MAGDQEQIRALTYEYAFRLDGGDFAGVGELLGAGRLRMSARGMTDREIRGAAAIERFYTKQVVTYGGDPRTRHQITNQVVSVADDGSSARAHCYFTVLIKPPGEPLQTVVSGRYFDRFERVDDGWRFSEKVIRVDYLTAIEKHFRIDDQQADPATRRSEG
jgi:hypothetical protein